MVEVEVEVGVSVLGFSPGKELYLSGYPYEAFCEVFSDWFSPPAPSCLPSLPREDMLWVLFGSFTDLVKPWMAAQLMAPPQPGGSC
jgi:hypothetical protein